MTRRKYRVENKRVLLLADSDTAGVSADGIDLIISLGDLHRSTIEQYRDAAAVKVGVYGNHCRRGYLEDNGFTNLHKTTREVFGLTLGGLEGCLRYKPGGRDVLYTEEEMAANVAQLPAAVDVLVLHAPPAGINDTASSTAHKGAHSVRAWVDRHRPKLILHGHVYPEDPVTVCGSSQVGWIYGAAYVDLNVRTGALSHYRPATGDSFTPGTGFDNAKLGTF